MFQKSIIDEWCVFLFRLPTTRPLNHPRAQAFGRPTPLRAVLLGGACVIRVRTLMSITIEILIGCTA
jgi:hypothetical protein